MTPPRGLRADIQALRGWAVLLVVLHHAWLLPENDAGYLGVDIFFVVSGYVITQLLLRQFDAGTFGFAQFYAKRARRLLPAAYVTLALTVALAPAFVLADEMALFLHQVLGSLTFIANLVLWGQTGYFAPEATFKPLLHMWSLAVEEQFYFLWPFALFWVPKRWRLALALVACATSLVLCLALNERMQGAVFYLLPARGWEMALGCIGALATRDGVAVAPPRWLSGIAVATVTLLPLHRWALPQPGAIELAVCLATLALLCRRQRESQAALLGPLVRIGDMSYSVYLVHWPLLSFAAATHVTEMQVPTRIALVFGALAAAFALHRWVEVPARRAAVAPRQTLVMAVAGAAAIALGAWAVTAMSLRHTPPQTLEFRRSNDGLSRACTGEAQFLPKEPCAFGANPKILLFGDSTAMHLADALRVTDKGGFVQATKSLCGPLLDMSAYRLAGDFDREWAKRCLSFQRAVVSWAKTQPGIEVVVLATAGTQYLVDPVLHADGSQAAAAAPDAGAVAAARLAAMALAFHKMGKRVVMVEPPPAPGFDVGRCIALKAGGRLAFGAPSPDCSFPRGAYEAESGQRKFLADAAAAAGVPVIRIADLLCDAERCKAVAGGVALYQDGGHLSHEGSAWVGRQLDFYSRVMNSAR